MPLVKGSVFFSPEATAVRVHRRERKAAKRRCECGCNKPLGDDFMRLDAQVVRRACYDAAFSREAEQFPVLPPRVRRAGLVPKVKRSIRRLNEGARDLASAVESLRARRPLSV